MSRKFALFLSFACLAVIAALTVACGKSASNNIFKTCTGGPYNVVGDWQITVQDNGGGSITGYGAIDSSGLALFFDNNALANSTGDTLQLPQLTGACSFSGNLTAYAAPNPLGSTVVTDPVQGNFSSATSMSASFTGSPSGTISANPFIPLSGSPTAFSGSPFTGEVNGSFSLGGVLLQLNFTPTGTGASMTFTALPSQNCAVTGSFTQQSSSNVFDVTMTFSGLGCPITTTSALTGLGFESNTDYFSMNGGAAGTYLYADMLNGSNTFVMEIF